MQTFRSLPRPNLAVSPIIKIPKIEARQNLKIEALQHQKKGGRLSHHVKGQSQGQNLVNESQAGDDLRKQDYDEVHLPQKERGNAHLHQKNEGHLLREDDDQYQGHVKKGQGHLLEEQGKGHLLIQGLQEDIHRFLPGDVLDRQGDEGQGHLEGDQGQDLQEGDTQGLDPEVGLAEIRRRVEVQRKGNAGPVPVHHLAVHPHHHHGDVNVLPAAVTLVPALHHNVGEKEARVVVHKSAVYSYRHQSLGC